MGSTSFDSLGKVMQKELKKDQHKKRTKIGSIHFASELCESPTELAHTLGEIVHSQLYTIIQEMKKKIVIADAFVGVGPSNLFDLSSVRMEPQDLIIDYELNLSNFRTRIAKQFRKGECWLKNGVKASTVFKQLLRDSFETIDKKNINRISTVMNSKAKECYTPEGNYIGYFGQGKFIGSGKWEPEGTCTRIKDKTKPFLYSAGWAEVQNRVFPLVARSVKTPTTQRGRVLVAFGGNGCIRFWNNYYLGQKITLNNFVKIFEEIYEIKLEKITSGSLKLPKEIRDSNFINNTKDLLYQNPSQGWWRIKKRPVRAKYIIPTTVRCAVCKKYVTTTGGTGADRHRFVCVDCSSNECPICKDFPGNDPIKLNDAHRKLLNHKTLCKKCYKKTFGICIYCNEISIEKYWFLSKKEKAEEFFCCNTCTALIVEGKHQTDDTLALECADCGVFVKLEHKNIYDKETNLCIECSKSNKE